MMNILRRGNVSGSCDRRRIPCQRSLLQRRNAKLIAAIKELLSIAGWDHLSDDQLQLEAEQGNEAAPIIRRARDTLAGSK